jgi:hypothetical protein
LGGGLSGAVARVGRGENIEQEEEVVAQGEERGARKRTEA